MPYNLLQKDLIAKVKSYDPAVNEKLLTEAYHFALKAHGAQKRQSGQAYFSHPLEVANLLTEKKMDHNTIITALLHDIVEDTSFNLSDIEKNFGKEVSLLVDGLTKIAYLDDSEREIKDSENLRKLLLASIGDIRVLIVKLADRLHNMRTLDYLIKKESRLRIAEQTLEIYVPLAERIGLKRWAEEMASLAFKELHPTSFEAIDKRLNFLYDEEQVIEIKQQLEGLLKTENLFASIKFRIKDHWSIYNKMQKKKSSMEDLSDIMAFRVILPKQRDCYLALWLLHHFYKTIPTKLKDYISSPKNNGYQSLHTVIIGPNNHKIEIQIRTQDMDNFAENGLAAHWVYKYGSFSSQAEKTKYQHYHDAALNWLKEFFEAVENQPSDHISFLDNTRTFLFTDRIYVSSPKGDLYELPQDALPLDFAFMVHSNIGRQFDYALVNGKKASFYTKLKNGDTVEIKTSDNKELTPEANWLHWLKTAKAKAFIGRKLKERSERNQITKGHDLLRSEIIQHGIASLSNNSRLEQVVDLERAYKKFSVKNADQLYQKIGQGQIEGEEVLFALYPDMKRAKIYKNSSEKSAGIDLSHFTKDISVKFPECCYPLPGDKITGVINLGLGLTVHRQNCKKLLPFQHHPERCREIHWQKKQFVKGIYTARLFLNLANKPGSLNIVTNALAKNASNIINLQVLHRDQEQFQALLDIEVFHLRQLHQIIDKVKSSGKYAADQIFEIIRI